VKLTRQMVTGGYRTEVVVNPGDVRAYRRMQEAERKIQTHQEIQARLETDARVYATQDTKTFRLTVEDVQWFNLGDRPHDE
jgi:hypothetical protein